MSKLFSALEDFLKKEDWTYRISGEEDILLDIDGENGSYRGSFFVDESRVGFYFTIPYNIPAENRTAVNEFLCRANYGLTLGNFELDLDRGFVNYKTTLIWEEENIPSHETLARLVYVNVDMLDRYFKGINSIVYGNSDPKEAVEKIEAAENKN